jgi:hypothetical protein
VQQGPRPQRGGGGSRGEAGSDQVVSSRRELQQWQTDSPLLRGRKGGDNSHQKSCVVLLCHIRCPSQLSTASPHHPLPLFLLFPLTHTPCAHPSFPES